MEWTLVIWLTLFGDGTQKIHDEASFPDSETCFFALERVQHELLVPEVSDRRRAITGFVAYCKPAVSAEAPQ